MQETRLRILNDLIKCCQLDLSQTNYFHERGLTDETITTFRLGFFGRHTLDYIKSLSQQDRVFLSAKDGLAIYPGYFSFPVIPIFDTQGIPIAIAVRTNSKVKYINSHYKKSENLFGLHLAKERVWEENRVFITEGYFDVMKAYQCGLHNTVGILSSNVGALQIELSARYTDNFVLVLDADYAGMEGAAKARQLIASKYKDISCSVVSLNASFRFVTTPVKDLDEFLTLHPLDFNALYNEKKKQKFSLLQKISSRLSGLVK